MKKTFADSFYFLALMNGRDSAHQRAIELSESLRGPIVTTDWVLVEVANAFRKPRDRGFFAKVVELVDSDDRIHVVSASKALFERGIQLYLSRSDKSWSLTDCISFGVMERASIEEALTGDQHFAQAGFVPMLQSE